MLHRRVEWYSNFRIEIFLREIRFTWIVVRSSIYNNGERNKEGKSRITVERVGDRRLEAKFF